MKKIAAACCVILAAACNPNAPCNWENRSVTSNGLIGPLNSRDLGASVTVTQVKGHSDHDQLGWNFWSDVYAGHVTGVTMYDASNPSRVLATFAISSPKAVQFSTSTDPGASATRFASLSELHDILVANGARVRATTDVTPTQPLDVALSVISQNDWAKMGCYARERRKSRPYLPT